MNDEHYMNIAINEAKKAYNNGDVPVGCVIVYKKNIKNKKMYEKVSHIIKDKEEIVLSKAYNERNKRRNSIYHAEIIAISKACKKIKDFRLEDTVMYVTLEPCQMCAGAIVQSRMKKVIVGAKSVKSGSCGSIINILDNDKFNHQVDIEYGVCEKVCSSLIKDFLKERRKK